MIMLWVSESKTPKRTQMSFISPLTLGTDKVSSVWLCGLLTNFVNVIKIVGGGAYFQVKSFVAIMISGFFISMVLSE